MEIRSLADVSLSAITSTFNEAFKNYFIPLQLSEGDMQNKFLTEGIRPEYSVGAFINGRLVGFILHAFVKIHGIKTIYNAGTGVVAEHRGKQITKRLYEYSIPILRQLDIKDHLLEVIDINTAALRVYESVGFTTARSLSSYKTSSAIAYDGNITIASVSDVPGPADFHSAVPSWQNTTASVNRNKDAHELIGAFDNGELVGYAAWSPQSGRVKQLGVRMDERRKGVGTALLSYMRAKSGNSSLLITNIDDAYLPAASFLAHHQFEKVITVFEMNMHC